MWLYELSQLTCWGGGVMTSCFISLYIRQYIIIIATRQQGARTYSTYSGWYSALSYKRKIIKCESDLWFLTWCSVVQSFSHDWSLVNIEKKLYICFLIHVALYLVMIPVADFHLCWRGGSTNLGVQEQQKLKNVCDLHTRTLAKTVEICLELHIIWLKWSKMVFWDLLSNPKHVTIYFRAQMKGWLATSEHNGKSAYGSS